MVALAADSHLYFPIFYAKATKCTGWDKVELRVAPAPKVEDYCISDDRIFSDLLDQNNENNILAFCDPMRWLWTGSETSNKPRILGTFIKRNPLLVRGSIPKPQAADFASTFDKYHIGISQLLVHPRGMSGFNSALYALWNSDFVKEYDYTSKYPGLEVELQNRIDFAKARFSKQGFPPALNPVQKLELLRKTYVQRQDEVQTAYLTEDILDGETETGKTLSTIFNYSQDSSHCNLAFTSLVTSSKFILDREANKILEELCNGLIHALRLIYDTNRPAEEIARDFEENRNWKIGLRDLGETEIAKLVTELRQRHTQKQTIHSINLCANEEEWDEARRSVAFSVALDQYPNNLVDYKFVGHTHKYLIGTGTREADKRNAASKLAHWAASLVIRLFKPSREKLPKFSVLMIGLQLVMLLLCNIPIPIVLFAMCVFPTLHLVCVSTQVYYLKRQLEGFYGKPVTLPDMKAVMGTAYLSAVFTAFYFNDKNGPDWLGIGAAPIIAVVVLYLKKARGVNLVDVFIGK